MNTDTLQVGAQQDQGAAWAIATSAATLPSFLQQVRQDEDGVPSSGLEQQTVPVPSIVGHAFQPVGLGQGSPAAIEGGDGMLPMEDMAEDNAKKLRRKLNNRESARRSRQKKADEISRLQAMVSQKDVELEQCKRSVSQLQMHVRTLCAKVSELGGTINEPGILQVLSAAPTEAQPVVNVQPVANVPSGDSQIPSDTAVNVLAVVAPPGQG